MAARVYHRETVAASRLNDRLRQVRARKYHMTSTEGHAVYQSPHGWIEVVPGSSGYVIKYYNGCPC